MQDEGSYRDDTQASVGTGTDDARIKLRTLRALEGIEFYLSELLYYKGLEHPEEVFDEDERREFTADTLRKYEDYRRQAVLRSNAGQEP